MNNLLIELKIIVQNRYFIILKIVVISIRLKILNPIEIDFSDIYQKSDLIYSFFSLHIS